jgi:hypothetical protein
MLHRRAGVNMDNNSGDRPVGIYETGTYLVSSHVNVDSTINYMVGLVINKVGSYGVLIREGIGTGIGRSYFIFDKVDFGDFYGYTFYANILPCYTYNDFLCLTMEFPKPAPDVLSLFNDPMRCKRDYYLRAINK